jgi:glycosyltransferase involved in cell wall biosynthesis
VTSPAVSVAIPLYNKAPFILATVQSVLAQQFTEFEIVVVDDGSTDGGAAQLHALNDSRLRIESQSNSGVAVARTRAMSLGRGRYVAFLDGDDLWHPLHLSRLMDLVRRYPEAELFGNSFAEAAGSMVPASTSAPAHYRLVEDYFGECAAGRMPFFTSSAMALRERALAVGGFPVGDYCGEDLALWILLAADAPVAVTDFVGCFYRRGIESLSYRPSYRNATDVSMLILDELARRTDWPEARRAAAREYYSRLALAHCFDCLQAGEMDQARKYMQLVAPTPGLRWRLRQARILSMAPRPLRAKLFELVAWRRATRRVVQRKALPHNRYGDSH